MCWEAFPEASDVKLYLHKSYLGRYVHISVGFVPSFKVYPTLQNKGDTLSGLSGDVKYAK